MFPLVVSVIIMAGLVEVCSSIIPMVTFMPNAEGPLEYILLELLLLRGVKAMGEDDMDMLLSGLDMDIDMDMEVAAALGNADFVVVACPRP